MAKIQIKQVKSRIGRRGHQKRTLDALVLRKLNHQLVHECTPDIMGMVNAVRHLVVVTEVEE